MGIFDLFGPPNVEKMLAKKNVAGLIKALQYREIDVRAKAAEALGKIGDPVAIDPLITAFRDKNNTIKETAKDALIKIGAPSVRHLISFYFIDIREEIREEIILRIGSQAVEPLIAELNDTYSHQRDDAARLLGKIGDARAIEPLRRVLHDYRNHVIYRKAAVEALGYLSAVDSLIEALGLGDNDLSVAVAEALVKIGDPRAVDPLIKTLGNGDGSVRKAAAVALEKLGEPKFWSQIIRGDNEDYIRLGNSKDTRFFEPLIKEVCSYSPDFSQDEDHAKAKTAAMGLKNLGDPRTVEHLITALLECNCMAAEALGIMGDSRAVEPLIFMLGHNRNVVRIAAAKALKQLGEPKWIDIVKGDEYKDYKRLGDSKDPRAFEPLIMALGIDETTYQAAQGLGKLGDPRAVDPLVKVLNDHKNTSIRVSAAEALGRIGDPSVVEPLIAALNALNDGEGEVSIAAAGALGESGDPRAVEPLLSYLDRAWGAFYSVGTYANITKSLSQIMEKSATELKLDSLKTIAHSLQDTYSTMNGVGSVFYFDYSHIKNMARQELIRRGIEA